MSVLCSAFVMYLYRVSHYYDDAEYERWEVRVRVCTRHMPRFQFIFIFVMCYAKRIKSRYKIYRRIFSGPVIGWWMSAMSIPNAWPRAWINFYGYIMLFVLLLPSSFVKNCRSSSVSAAQQLHTKQNKMICGMNNQMRWSHIACVFPW